MMIDLIGKGVRVICNTMETGKPGPKAPHDVEGTVLYLDIHSHDTAVKAANGDYLDIITNRDNAADIIVRWDNDHKASLWAGALILRSTGRLSACASIWGRTKEAYVDDRPFHELRPCSTKPLSLRGFTKRGIDWSREYGMTTAKLTTAPKRKRQYVMYASVDDVPVGHPAATIERPSDGAVCVVHKHRNKAPELHPLSSYPGEIIEFQQAPRNKKLAYAQAYGRATRSTRGTSRIFTELYGNGTGKTEAPIRGKSGPTYFTIDTIADNPCAEFSPLPKEAPGPMEQVLAEAYPTEFTPPPKEIPGAMERVIAEAYPKATLNIGDTQHEITLDMSKVENLIINKITSVTAKAHDTEEDFAPLMKAMWKGTQE